MSGPYFPPPRGYPPGYPPGPPPMGYPPRHMMMGLPPPQGLPFGLPPRPGFAPPGAALLPPPLPPAPLPPADDPANWTAHAGQDGKMYYHNRVTKVSTYDKPACLAAAGPAPPGPPSSLPPCKWKEHKTPEGKTYYSDGTTSVWEEPTELTAYKAKVKALEEEEEDTVEVVGEVKVAPAAQAKGPVETIEVLDDDSSDDERNNDDEASAAGDANGSVNSAAGAKEAAVLRAAVKQEPPDDDDGSRSAAPQDDAVSAFKQMLFDKGVSSTVKWGDVQKILSKESVWGSLKTGEKKQAFAEYQTKRMKEEKEEKRARVRKARDSFLKMLAECVEIDSKSRWRTAEELLGDDPRFKTAELSSHDKEDIFNDFITELAKKEKEEARLNKKAFAEMVRRFAGLVPSEKSEEKTARLTRSMTWRDAQTLLDELATADEERRLRDLVEEVDQKHAFEDVIEELEKAHREQKRIEREERRKVEEERRKVYRTVLVGLAEQGKIEMDSKWKHLKVVIEQEDAYKAMIGQGGPTAAELFDKFVDELRGHYLEDKRKLRDNLPRAGAEVGADWTQDMYVAAIKKALGAPDEEAAAEEGDEADKDKMEVDNNKDPAKEKKEEGAEAAPADEEAEGAKKEGKEATKSSPRSAARTADVRRLRELDEMLTKRPKHVAAAFQELHKRAVELAEEEARRQEKRVARYKDLLLEYFWRSDHVDVAWKEAQRDLSRHSAYNALDSEARLKLFDEHMAMLRSKMEKKKKHQKELLEGAAAAGGTKDKGSSKDKSSAAKKARKDASSGSGSSGSSSSSSDYSSSSESSDSEEDVRRGKGSKGGKGDDKDRKRRARSRSRSRPRSGARSRSRSRERPSKRTKKPSSSRARSGSRSD